MNSQNKTLFPDGQPDWLNRILIEPVDRFGSTVFDVQHLPDPDGFYGFGNGQQQLGHNMPVPQNAAAPAWSGGPSTGTISDVGLGISHADQGNHVAAPQNAAPSAPFGAFSGGTNANYGDEIVQQPLDSNLADPQDLASSAGFDLLPDSTIAGNSGGNDQPPINGNLAFPQNAIAHTGFDVFSSGTIASNSGENGQQPFGHNLAVLQNAAAPVQSEALLLGAIGNVEQEKRQAYCKLLERLATASHDLDWIKSLKKGADPTEWKGWYATRRKEYKNANQRVVRAEDKLLGLEKIAKERQSRTTKSIQELLDKLFALGLV